MTPRGLSPSAGAPRTKRLPFLFFLFVLVPAVPLAWLAMKAVYGSREPVAAEINALLAHVGERAVRILTRPVLDCEPEFSRRIRPGLSLDLVPAAVAASRSACPYVTDVFILDRRLRPLYPFREPAERTGDILFGARPDERIAGYSRAMRAGSAQEFVAGDPGAALREYRTAAQEAGNPQTRAIALLSEARCNLKTGNFAEAFDRYREILAQAGEGVSYHGLSLRLLAMTGAADAARRAGNTAEAAERFFGILRGLAAGELAGSVHEAAFYASMIADLRGEFAAAGGAGAPAPARFDAALREWDVTKRAALAMEQLRERFGPDLRRVAEEGAGGYRVLSRTIGGEETLAACGAVALEGQAEPAALVAVFDARGLRERMRDILRDAVASEPDVNLTLSDAEGNAFAGCGDPGNDSPHVLTRSLAPVFPAWRLRLAYRKDGLLYELAARERRTRTVYSSLLLLIILMGLSLTYWLVTKDSELARLKSEFVSRVSHELRTPLSTIRAVGEMLEMGAVSSREKEKEYFTFITSEGQRLSRLIDNVLDFSRIGAGKRAYTLRPADLGKTVASTVRAFRQYVQPEGIEVVYEADPVIPRVLADEDAVSQALLNLLDNAVKFSPGEKGVRVELRRRLGEVLIRVSDRGIGIAPGDLEKIFFQFYRVDEGRKVARKGAGIGLSIVKHIAEAHGGRVEVESDLGGGSVFAIVIPVPVELAE